MEAIILIIILINIQSPQVLFFIPGARSCFTKVVRVTAETWSPEAETWTDSEF